MAEFEELKGKTIKEISVSNDKTEVTFTCESGEKYIMTHFQVCCEEVYLEDVVGDLDDLIGSPILLAEKVTSHEPAPPIDDGLSGSQTWTFYKLATVEGSVTFRWYGTSNGYYSEEVDFVKVEE